MLRAIQKAGTAFGHDAAIDSLRRSVSHALAVQSVESLRIVHDSIAWAARLDSIADAASRHAFSDQGSLYAAIASAIAAVAAVAIALTEPYRRERRDRQAVSGALAAEIARASYVIRATHAEWGKSPVNFGLETQLYAALANRLSALPDEALVLVVAVYGEFAWLNRAWIEMDRLLAAQQRGSFGAVAVIGQLNKLSDEFERKLRATLPLCDAVCRRLGKPIPPYITGEANF